MSVTLYEQKQRWKLFLAISAAVIVGATLIYTGNLVRKIASEERDKVKLWAQAVQKRAKLVQVTKELFSQIENDESKKAEVLANATIGIIESDDSEMITTYSQILESNTTIPVIVTYENGDIWTYRNLTDEDNNDPDYIKSELQRISEKRKPILLTNKQFGQGNSYYFYYDDSKVYTKVKNTLNELVTSFITETVINSSSTPVVYTDSTMTRVITFGNINTNEIFNGKPYSDSGLIDYVKGENEPIRVELGKSDVHYILYRDSLLITQLKFFPYVQLTIIGLFLLVAYFLFSTARRSEQNRVWVGMSKETAHQLGTPLFSLLGWIEILKSQGVDESVTDEITKDVDRLRMIAERFSKVGSIPELKQENLLECLHSSVEYMKIRTSDKIQFGIHGDSILPTVLLNRQLFEWVIENLCRNAVDAIQGKGSVSFDVHLHGRWVFIDISDTGKGIPKNKWKSVFRPGFTTKQRGWGLGLSLTKRIIEEYHKGKIFVKSSEPGHGTTFRIQLKIAD